MFGSKLRSWMEAVRPRKKQHRKEKQTKINSAALAGPKTTITWDASCNKNLHSDDKSGDSREVIASNLSRSENQCQSGASRVSNSDHSRYSANNLSSPESAYSTGYSTDGTSPGAPPEYLLNNSGNSERYHPQTSVLNAVPVPSSPRTGTIKPSKTFLPTASAQGAPNHLNGHGIYATRIKRREVEEPKPVPPQPPPPPPPPARTIEINSGPVSPALGITSPRQRNRIRTNPWLPGGVPMSPVKHEIKATIGSSKSIKDSPRTRRFLSPAMSRRRSLSSSSCSSLSGTSLHMEPPRPRSASDDDCTLNEMMGKYDESYVYEKETDILSDSDPTDCETDIDTGQDGGDEDDPFEGELDFIDNGSYLEFDPRPDHNTGHCSYYNYDAQRKRSSRRRTPRRSSKQPSEKKRRSSSNKKRIASKLFDREKFTYTFLDRSKSAGATPLSVRRASHRPVSKLALEECLKKRSNSISFYRDQITTIDKRDKEADLKYKELIGEAEQILRTMKTNGLSPRRLPGPANKRVELLRTAECAKPELFIKNKALIAEDNSSTNPFYSKIPSNSYNCPRFSPKKNHITNFIISNSPVLVRKEWEMQTQEYKSPLSNRKILEETHHVQKGILHREKNSDGSRMSPRYRRKFSKLQIAHSSSDSEDEPPRHTGTLKSCPQSEPLRRKVYLGYNSSHKSHGNGKTVAFNLGNEASKNVDNKNYATSSTENLRQQVLLNTIVNLKRNLEDQSASLKQVYRSSQNIYV